MPQKLTISLAEAVTRVTRFRNYFLQFLPQSTCPRAILIPFDAIVDIVNKYHSVDSEGNVTNDLKGIRAYLSIDENDPTKPQYVTAVVVPVDLDGNDIIYPDNQSRGDGDEDDDTEIYDFTMPCPSECDEESPLIVPPPPPAG
jgi:hypothetical protein